MQQAQVIVSQPRDEARMRLICFPSAGATDAVFANWAEYLPTDIEVGAMRKAGDVNNYHDLIPILTQAVLDYVSVLPARPFALFGHSLGSILAFGVAHQLQRRKEVQPFSLHVASADGPQMRPPTVSKPAEEWTLDDLETYLRMQGGTAETILKNPARMRRLLGKMQVDLALLASYRYEEASPLTYPLAVFAGQQDQSVTRDGLLGWETHTRSQFTLYRFPGDHFFLHHQQMRSTFLQALQSELYRWYASAE